MATRLVRSLRLLEKAAQHHRLGLLAAGEAAAVLPPAAAAVLPPAAAAAAALSPAAGAAALPVLHRRWYAQPRSSKAPMGSYAPPAGGARPMNVRITMVSSNLLAEPYQGEPPRLPLSAWVTPSGWKERWRRWINGAKSIYTVSKCRRLLPGWTLPGFKADALAVYQEACAALAAGDRTALRQLVTPSVYSDLKRQIKQREDGGWAKVEWALISPPTLKEIEVLQGRMIAVNPKDDSTGFAQLTVQFRSRQRFVALDRRGRVVAGTPGGEIAVDDHWVFERPLKAQTASRWRVAGILTIPRPPGSARGGQQAGQAAAAVEAATG